MTLTDPTLLAIRQTVVEQPNCDINRGIFAERLDDLGEHEWAKFVRLQCANHDRHVRLGWKNKGPYRWSWTTLSSHMPTTMKWKQVALKIGRSILPEEFEARKRIRCTIDRGFVWRLDCPMIGFMVKKCDCTDAIIGIGCRCPTCHNTGWGKPGLAQTLFGAHPITEVVIIDREPMQGVGAFFGEERYGWEVIPVIRGANQNAILPFEIFSRLPPPDYKHNEYRCYWNSREAAMTALSIACVRYARSLHNLPELITHREVLA